jgi:hypothetical protein
MDVSEPTNFRVLSGFWFNEVFEGYSPPAPLIKGILTRGELIVLYGESGVLKSFCALDIACCIASGTPWCGRKLLSAGVLYFCGEGGQGFLKRVRAWALHHGISGDALPAFFPTQQPDLMEVPDAVANTLAAAEAAMGRPIELVVFDTLTASFGPGDESKTEDMQKVLRNVREACGQRTIILVHHVGHMDKARERGSYSLIAAADRRIKAERPSPGDQVVLTCMKSKDDAPFDPIALAWKVVPLGWYDMDGDELTSVVLEPTGKPAPKVSKAHLGKVQAAVLAVIRSQKDGIAKTELVAVLKQQGTSASSVYDACDSLETKGLINKGISKVIATNQKVYGCTD